MPPNTAITPFGNNDLSSYALYFQRLYYKNEIYPSSVVKPLDTWYDKQLYGLIDKTQNTIIPRPAQMRAIGPSIDPGLLAFNFVVDAFEALVNHMQKGVISGVLRRNGNIKLTDMRAHVGYRSATDIYNRYLDQVYNAFVENLPLKDYNEITNFQTFADKFTAYLRRLSLSLPVTQTSYQLSGITNTLSSGLSIAIDVGQAQNDTYKYNNFINDPNFQFYIRAAKKFGFTVNKNMPWILTADLFSDAIMKYLGNYRTSDYTFVTKVNFFDLYYNRTYLNDMNYIQRLITSGYRDFIDNSPLYEIATPGTLPSMEIFSTSQDTDRCGQFNFESHLRAPLPAHPTTLITDKFMVMLYLTLRSNEVNNPLSSLKTMRLNVASVYQTQPDASITKAQNAANYINMIFRDYIYDIGYIFLNDTIRKEGVDNQARTGNISTAAAVTQQLY